MLLGVLLGGVTGLSFRLVGALHGVGGSAQVIMTLAFLILGPFAVGWVAASVAERVKPLRWWERITIPWPAMLLSAGLTWLFNIEGLICVVFALPIALVFASLGGLAGGAAAAADSHHEGKRLAVVLLLPLLLPPLENRMLPPTQVRTVATEMVIQAPPSTVWHNVESVRLIQRAELQPTWTHAIGFPRPVEATLSREGVGGVRHASFEHGLLFVETVTRWEPERALGFSIKADVEHLPPTTLDEHVKIGGRFFDVLDGEYRLEPLAGGRVLLHLSSQERLSTDFNPYAGLWSDAVMGSLQVSILQVIKKRCEKEIQDEYQANRRVAAG